MTNDFVALAEKYYQLVGSKNAEKIEKLLHPDVQLISPFATLAGKEAVFQATCNFMSMVTELKIRKVFGADEQAMVVYDSAIPDISSSFPGASLLTFQDGLIIKIELFYDGSRFIEMKDEIFS